MITLVNDYIHDGICKILTSCVPRYPVIWIMATGFSVYVDLLSRAYLPGYINEICVNKTKEVAGETLGGFIGPFVVVPVVTPFLAPRFSLEIRGIAFVVATIVLNLTFDFFYYYIHPKLFGPESSPTPTPISVKV